MHQIIFGLCALTAAACAGLLLQAWRTTRFRLLLWSGMCFAGLTVNNILLILDRYVFSTDLSTWRLAVGLAAVLLLLCGMIVESSS
jgi:hypothetical protein